MKLYESSVKQGKKPVNIFVGRFQPFHMGHYKACEELYKSNGHPVVLLSVRSSGKSGKGTNFTSETTNNILGDVIKESGFIIDHKEVRFVAYDTQVFPALRPKYEPVLLGAGEDRYSQYENQRNRMMTVHNNKINMRDDFAIFKTKRYASGTAVRQALMDDNYTAFKNMMPKFLHKYWDVLKEELDLSMVAEGVSEQIGKMAKNHKTFEGFKNAVINKYAEPIDNINNKWSDINNWLKDIYNTINEGGITYEAPNEIPVHNREDIDNIHVTNNINTQDGPIDTENLDHLYKTIGDCKVDLAKTGAAIDNIRYAIEQGVNIPNMKETLSELISIRESIIQHMKKLMKE